MKKAKVRVGVLDQEVERRQPEPGDLCPAKASRSHLPEPEPWAEPVDGADLIAASSQQIQRFVILSPTMPRSRARCGCSHAFTHDAAFA